MRMMPYAFLCVLVDLWPNTQPATQPVAKDSLYLCPRSKPPKHASKFMASQKSSGHRTSHLTTLSPPPPPRPSICALPPPLSLSFPCHRVHCVNVAFTVKYSRCLYSFLSSRPPSAFFTSSCFPCSRGGRNVNVASSSKLVFSPSLLSSFFISFFSRKILCKCLWTRATKPCCI